MLEPTGAKRMLLFDPLPPFVWVVRQAVKTPVFVPVSVNSTRSESPTLLVTVTLIFVIPSETLSRSVTRMQTVELAGNAFVAGPLLPLVNSVVLGVPRSRKVNVTLVTATSVMPSVPSLAVIATL